MPAVSPCPSTKTTISPNLIAAPTILTLSPPLNESTAGVSVICGAAALSALFMLILLIRLVVVPPVEEMRWERQRFGQRARDEAQTRDVLCVVALVIVPGIVRWRRRPLRVPRVAGSDRCDRARCVRNASGRSAPCPRKSRDRCTDRRPRG